MPVLVDPAATLVFHHVALSGNSNSSMSSEGSVSGAQHHQPTMLMLVQNHHQHFGDKKAADIEATLKAGEVAAEEAIKVIAAVSTEIEAAITAEEEFEVNNVDDNGVHVQACEVHNEDDDDVQACLLRIEEARVDAVKKEISAVAAGIEAAMNTEEETRTANTASSAGVEAAVTPEEEADIQHSNSFLRQFEDLDLKEEREPDSSLKQNDSPVAKAQDTSVDDLADIMSPTMLINYFSTIDQRTFEGENEEKFIDDFKRLMMPVVNGSKPTVIEEAQIRQAALKANVPLDFVDTFIDYVKDEHPKIAPQLSVDDDRDFLLKGWEEIEDINEDAAIAFFLSPKFVAQVSDEGDKCKEADDDLCETKLQPENEFQEKKAKDLIDASSHDYEPEEESSVISMTEPDFNRSKDTEPDYNRSKEDTDCETKPDYNRSKEETDCETEPDFNRSKEETDCERSECNTTDSDDFHGLKESEEEEETDEDFSFSIPKVVGTIKRHENDPVDTEMVKACRSIETYDEGIWQRRTAMATYGWGWEEATCLSSRKSPRASNLSGAGINGVAGAEGVSNLLFNKKSFPLARKNCKLSYNRRVRSHTGYWDVDVHSLQESAAFGEENLRKDETPWELRYVRQRFLHERSLTFSRNWFGNLVKTGGNDKIKAPICKPKSMEMPMRNVPDPGDWTPEWYTAPGRKLLSRRSSTEGSIDSGSESDTEKDYNDGDSQVSGSYSSSSSYEDDEDWEDAPECGTLVNTKQKIGEQVTRVHPDYTSSLRKSRWRKKYFPIGTFPY